MAQLGSALGFDGKDAHPFQSRINVLSCSRGEVLGGVLVPRVGPLAELSWQLLLTQGHFQAWPQS
jgi:hypothetical protein